MIEWQGPPSFGESLRPSADIAVRAVAAAAFMFAAGYMCNVVSLALWWLDDAPIILFPLVGFWGVVAFATLFQILHAPREMRLTLSAHSLIAMIAMLPIAWLTVVHWQRPVLISQLLIAQFLRDTFR